MGRRSGWTVRSGWRRADPSVDGGPRSCIVLRRAAARSMRSRRLSTSTDSRRRCAMVRWCSSTRRRTTTVPRRRSCVPRRSRPRRRRPLARSGRSSPAVAGVRGRRRAPPPHLGVAEPSAGQRSRSVKRGVRAPVPRGTDVVAQSSMRQARGPRLAIDASRDHRRPLIHVRIVPLHAPAPESARAALTGAASVVV